MWHFITLFLGLASTIIRNSKRIFFNGESYSGSYVGPLVAEYRDLAEDNTGIKDKGQEHPGHRYHDIIIH